MTRSVFGSWKPVSVVMAGNPFDQDLINTMSLVLSEEEYLAEVDGTPDRGTCTFDTSTDPQRIQIVGTEGPNAGKTFLAVYDFADNGDVRLAYDLTGAAYPTGFESTAENGLFVVTYRRVK
ncbi:MAG: TIGR03067 domain-containing protein [Planctomycetota bacterium]